MSSVKSLHWDITKNCNLRCNHCYNADKYFKEMSDEFIENDLSYEESISVVKDFHQRGFKHIHMLGGEPLKSPYIFEVIQLAKSLDMKVTINSNGTLLNWNMQRALIDSGVDQFAVSIDGCTSKVNDAIRGKGTFERVCKNIKSLNHLIQTEQSPLQTVIVFTLTKANINELIMLPELANECGVNLITLTTFIESGMGKSNQALFEIETDHMCEKIEEMVSSKLVEYGIPLQIDMRPRFCDYLAMKYNAPIIYNPKNSICSAGEDMWYMESNGNVHPCLVYQLNSGKQALQDGVFKKETLSINRMSFEEIEQSDYWSSFIREKHKFDPQRINTCENCNYLGSCLPCFVDYGQYDLSIVECEWTKRKETELYEYYSDKEYILNEPFTYDVNTGEIKANGNLIVTFKNMTSRDMFNGLFQGKNVREILEVLSKEYAVDETILKLDILTFTLQMLKNNILKIAN